MFWHIESDIISLLVIALLLYFAERIRPFDERFVKDKSFIWCLRAGVLMTVVDIAASLAMDYAVSRFVYNALMSAYLLTQELIIVLWFLYALSILYEGDLRGRRRMSAAVLALYAPYCVAVLLNHFTGWFYTLGPNMEYSRGLAFLPLLVGVFAANALWLLALIFIRRRKIAKGYPRIVLIMQPLILAAAIPVQLLNPGWLVLCPAYMVCLVLAFLFFQNVTARDERQRLNQLTEMVEHFACGLAISVLRPDGQLEIQYLSGGLARIYGMESGELYRAFSRNYYVGVHPDDLGMVQNRITEMAESRGRQEYTFRYVAPDGVMRWLHIIAEAEPREGGSAIVYATYTDLTEQKRAEAIIDQALDNTGVSIWEYDYDKKRITQYQNSTVMHGFEQVVHNVPEGLVESGFVHPESAGDFLAMYKKLREGAPFAEGVFRVQTSDRRGYWYEHIRYTNDFDKNGEPIRAIGMSTDETERQEALIKYDRELEKERGFMAEEGILAHASFDLTSGETLDYRFADGREVPEEQRTAFTYGRHNAGLMIDEAEREAFLRLNDRETLLRRFAGGENEFKLEYRRRLPNGVVSWVRNTLRLLHDPLSGNILLFAYWYDIENEKMQDLMYRSIATDNYDFVARIDGRTRSFDVIENTGLYQLPPTHGDDADEVTRVLYDNYVLPEDRAMAVENSLIATIHRHLAGEGRYTFTYRLRRPSGELRYKKITQYYIDRQREIIAVLREDVTDLIRQETEKNRVLSEALDAAKQANGAKSQFLSRVSHELRTPLNAIIGFMELSRDADAEQVRDYLAHSDAAAKQLLSIINDVLDVSSIESGKLRLAHAPFDFRKLIKSLTELFEPQCRKKGLRYETTLLSPVDEWLMGDQLRVNQILLNLLGNALKFTERGGVSLRISQREAGDGRLILRFQVADTGCGMTAELQRRLFRPFEQESASTAQKYGGNGLGLSIVGSLVAMMDGFVSVESRPGQGSVFTVDLPFTRGEAELSAGVLIGAEELSVLCVDDEASDRDYLTAVLGRIGVRCRCVAGGRAALEAMEAERYRVLLIDWKMPDMNGPELCRELRRLYGDTPYIALTSAYDHYQAGESVKAAGGNIFLSKPLFQSTLFDLFSTLTGGQTAARPGPEEAPDLSNMRILLAEDNLMNRMVAENIIKRKFGAQCDCVENGREAYERFLNTEPGHYDVILMDIQMPEMDGYEATRRIRASSHPDAREIEIIALTANAFSEDITRSLSAGMNAHLSKPIEPDTLGRALARACAERRRNG